MKPAEYQIHVGKEILGSSKKIREALIAREVEKGVTDTNTMAIFGSDPAG